jgi:2-haloacid dehalogenase
MPQPPILVFDVNETLLDLSALDQPFAAAFGVEMPRARGIRKAWFTELLHEVLITIVTGPYVNFSSLARSALRVTAERVPESLADGGIMKIMSSVTKLPPHDDVDEALDRLADAGFRMTALSNGTPNALAAQLKYAGLTARFEKIASAEHAGRLKPAPEPYRLMARELDTPPEDLCMVAAHAWDTTGALRAGLQAAFIARPGKVLSDADPEPEIIGSSLTDVADALIRTLEA